VVIEDNVLPFPTPEERDDATFAPVPTTR